MGAADPDKEARIARLVRNIETVVLDGVAFYQCGILPLRINRDDLVADIIRAQGPEWRT